MAAGARRGRELGRTNLQYWLSNTPAGDKRETKHTAALISAMVPRTCAAPTLEGVHGRETAGKRASIVCIGCAHGAKASELCMLSEGTAERSKSCSAAGVLDVLL
jgi:hypothetical protein